MFAYCSNNPIARLDATGCIWEAIVVGFVVGVVGQYVSDVIGNIRNGETGAGIFTKTSSLTDYLASGLGGAVAAIPGMKLAGTMIAGAAGNVISDGLKGKIKSAKDVGKSALKGAVANGIGYGVAKGIAAVKVKQISRMPRAKRKVYLRDTFYGNSQSSANKNLKTFSSSSVSSRINILELKLRIFRSGIYSSITSTVANSF